MKIIPVFLIDYQNDEIILDSWRNVKISKEDVIRKVEMCEKFPYKTTRHMIKTKNEIIHISKFVGKINFPIENR